MTNALAPEALESLTPEERHGLHKILKLEVTLRPDGPPEVSYAFIPDLAPLEVGEYAPLETTR
jgi:hypothetical protein